MMIDAETAERTTEKSSEPLADLTALIQRIAGGDDAALESLYEFTVGKVYGLALAISKSREDAEEISCDVYTQVWVKAVDFDSSRGNPMAWLLMMCRSRALDLLRRNQKHIVDVVEDTGAAESTGADLDTPDKLLAGMQDNADVTRALKSLTDVQRQVVMLAFFRGLSHAEVADALGMPLGTVKSHIRRALQSLHESLDLSL